MSVFEPSFEPLTVEEREFRVDVDRVQRLPLPLRQLEDALITPALDDMAAAPGAAQTLYRVTYERVGRRGGRDGSQPPAPLTTWAVSPDHLADLVAKDVSPYLLSRDIGIDVDLGSCKGAIYSGLNNGGSFTIEQLAVRQ